MILYSIAEAKGAVGGLVAGFGRAVDASRRDVDGSRVLTRVGLEAVNLELGRLADGR